MKNFEEKLERPVELADKLVDFANYSPDLLLTHNTSY